MHNTLIVGIDIVGYVVGLCGTYRGGRVRQTLGHRVSEPYTITLDNVGGVVGVALFTHRKGGDRYRVYSLKFYGRF